MFLLILMLLLGVQQPSPQFPPGVPAPKGSIEGIVFRNGTDEPLAKARVELTRSELGRLSDVDNVAIQNMLRARAGSPSTTTDASGKFVFRDLDDGRYVVTVTRDGYVRQEYGQRGRNDAGAVVRLNTGEHLQEVVLRMMPAPTISGVVVDPNNVPLAGAKVEAFQLRQTLNGRTLSLVQAALTDDLGAYRLFWLNPGEYFVAASYSSGYPRALIIPGVPQGTNMTDPDEGYAKMYYPGTPVSSEASAITLTAGSDAAGTNIKFKDLPRFTVRGQVVDATTNRSPDAAKQAGGVQIAFIPSNNNSNFVYSNRTDAQGRFEIHGVVPGSYSLLAIQTSPARGSSPEVRVNVASKDVENLSVPFFPGVTIPGRITVESEGRAMPDLSTIFVGLSRSKGGIGPRAIGIVNADGGFAIPDVSRGFEDYDVGLVVPIPGFYLKAARVGGRDVLQSGLQVSKFDGMLEIVLSGDGAQVSGSVLDREDKPVTAAQVVLVPEEAWRQRADRFRRTSTDSSGSFQTHDLPPGRYTAFAFEEVEAGKVYDLQFLERFRGRGVEINVDENGKAAVSLKAIAAQESAAGGNQ